MLKLLNIQCLTFHISPVVYYLTLILNCYSSEPELHTLWALTSFQVHNLNQWQIKSIWGKNAFILNINSLS